MKEATVTVPLDACPSRVLVNDGATGYYRSAYTIAEAKKLLGAGLSSPERRSVLQDISAGVDRAEIQIADALGLVHTLSRDKDEKVAASGAGFAGYAFSRELSDEYYAKGKRFVLKELGPLARRLGWKRKKSDSDDVHALRRSVVGWVAGSGDKQLAAEARKLALAWLDGKRDLPDDIVGSVLGVTVRKGDAALFDRVLEAARKATDRREQSRLIRLLGAFDDPAIAAKALAVVESNEFDLRESEAIVYGLLYGRRTREIAWTWIQERLDALLPMMREDGQAGTLAAIAGAFCDQAHRDQAAELVLPRAKKVGGAENAVAAALEGSDQCIVTFARNRPAIEAFLAKY
jgi:cytosol alanyl aminopeptidase